MLFFESRKQAMEVVYTIRNIGNYKIYGNKEEEDKILKQLDAMEAHLRKLYYLAGILLDNLDTLSKLYPKFSKSDYTKIVKLENLVYVYKLYSMLINEKEQVEKLAEEQIDYITRVEELGMSTEEMKSILYGNYLHLLAESIIVVKIGSKYIPYIYKNINIFKHFKKLEPFIEIYR